MGEAHVDAIAADDGDGPEEAAGAAGGEEGGFTHICRKENGEESCGDIQPSLAGGGVERNEEDQAKHPSQ